MFRSAATKIAHNSTLPSLNIAGNKDLKPLQDLIIAEKAVLISLQKLSVDFNKASEALRIWGMGEGDDLGDTLNASTAVLTQFSACLATFATHEHVIRDHMKAIRTREETLDELKRRRKNVGAKAETAEKKLNKMSSEHKNMPAQTELLNRLKDEMRSLGGEIMAEEASLGDFKREATREWMALKFGGLAETCDKGSIVAQVGKQLIAEIPVEQTQPGLPRAMYTGHARIESLLSEAQSRISEIHLDATAGLNQSSDYNQAGYQMPPSQFTTQSDGSFMANSFTDQPNTFNAPTSDFSTPSNQFYPGSNLSSTYPPQSTSEGLPPRSVDDFGVVGRHNPGGSQDFNAGGGKFATFPIKSAGTGAAGGSFTGRSPPLEDKPPLLEDQDQDDNDSFASEVRAALGMAEVSPAQQGRSFSEPETKKDIISQEQPRKSTGDSAPPYEYEGPSTPQYSQSVPPPPPGAALANPWHGSSYDNETEDKRRSLDDVTGLAYMTVEEPTDESRLSRHVRFGGADEEIDPTTPDSWNHDAQRNGHTSSLLVTPNVNPADEERQRNAAAAREVSIDPLPFNPPVLPSSPPPELNQSGEIQNEPESYPQDPYGYQNSYHQSPAPSPIIPTSRVAPPSIDTQQSSSPPRLHSPSFPRSSTENARTSPTSPSSPRQQQQSFQPPSISLPSPRLTPQLSSSGSTPYRTPTEYPRAPSSPMNKSSLSLASPPAGARTISAAAFKNRPQPRHGSDSISSAPGGTDVNPLSIKKRLPTSPRPSGKDVAAPAPEEEPFDYISAYTNQGGSVGGSGYGDGRFSTNLDDRHS